MEKRKLFWLKLCLLNLAIVALLGFTLRSKILFPIPWIDYRSLLSAHSHFAFSGWVGLSLTVLLVHNLLPPHISEKKFYQWMLGMMEVSSLGMAISFPIQGYGSTAIFFSSSYIIINYVFAAVFIKDVVKAKLHKTVKLLAVSSIASLLISAIGPLGLVYILLSKSADSILYRDSVYTFLHFQYNGFFTLAVFAILFHFLLKKGIALNKKMQRFATFLSLAILPSVFLSLLWHDNQLYYAIGAIGCALVLVAILFFIAGMKGLHLRVSYTTRITSVLLTLSLISFGIKMLLNAGTLIPSLGIEVYGDRPVIIGFLHLVFLAFVSFFILGQITEEGMFSREGRVIRMPLIVFMCGVILNEAFLMIQGLGILFMTNSGIYNWLLWGAAIVLLTGGILLAAFGFKQKSYPAG